MWDVGCMEVYVIHYKEETRGKLASSQEGRALPP